MEAPTSPIATFTHFPDLPAELRIQIWEESLPSELPPALHFYRQGCWHPWRLQPDHEWYNAKYPTHNLIVHFKHQMLDPVPVKTPVPLLSVCREARDVALGWAAKQGMRPASDAKAEKHEGAGPARFISPPFDVSRDVMYIPQDRFADFVNELNSCIEPDLIGETFCLFSGVRKIAIPESIFLEQDRKDMFNILMDYPSVQTICIVIDTPEKLQPPENDGKTHVAWEIDGMSTDAGAFIWNREHISFEPDSNVLGSAALHKKIMMLNQGDDGWLDLGKRETRDFKIQPILVVRR
jgi:hypothetical protein